MKYINMLMTDEAYNTIKEAALKYSYETGEQLTPTEYSRFIVLEAAENYLNKKV